MNITLSNLPSARKLNEYNIIQSSLIKTTDEYNIIQTSLSKITEWIKHYPIFPQQESSLSNKTE